MVAKAMTKVKKPGANSKIASVPFVFQLETWMVCHQPFTVFNFLIYFYTSITPGSSESVSRNSYFKASDLDMDADEYLTIPCFPVSQTSENTSYIAVVFSNNETELMHDWNDQILFYL